MSSSSTDPAYARKSSRVIILSSGSSSLHSLLSPETISHHTSSTVFDTLGLESEEPWTGVWSRNGA
ncbi:hypothetical protein FH972_015228 [Carpinus fangiana]|uniref:Uncharacterized protein n=1 Tax=Carpinus fangiana TaxID=176857 RepID=A0A5N6RFP9_9ROSI|nr:hypothetical protein FH972_015228 [Carpinus fangiana]